MANTLLWKFEAFREFISYDVLQPAASVLSLFEGEYISEANPRIRKLEKLLTERTGKDTWKPNRSGTPDLLWNAEGDFTRNKERLLTSMLIMKPKEFTNGTLKLTQFGQALAAGQISRSKFYRYIVSNFKYPHPAYEDNWTEWLIAKKTVRPFIFILQILVLLFEMDPSECRLSVRETEHLLIPSSNHDEALSLANEVIKSRKSNSLQNFRPAGDLLTRKVSDMFGFLCITGYTCFMKNGDITLVLVAIHSVEKTYYQIERQPPKREKESVIDSLKNIISTSLDDSGH